MKKLFLVAFVSLFFAHVGLSDTYVWEDYDDFSGSSLVTSKWEAGYFSGGQAATVSGGAATLSGSGYTGSDVENVPSIWQDAASQSTGQSNSGLFVTSTEIYGIEVEVSIPQSGNSQNVGFIVETHSADGSTYNGIELAWRENGLNWSYENENPSTAQILELSQEADFDTSYTLSVIHTGSRMELHINGTRVANLNSNFTPNHWLIGSFNDEGKTFTVPIDNVRVLRRSTSETLDGSTLFLDSDDPVTLTLAFENDAITSTFEDGGEDSGTETGIQYDYIMVDHNRFSITETPQLDGDYITFDKASSRGKLFDFKSDGQIDESGTWEFSFTIEDFEGYAPSSLVGQTLYISELAYNFDYYFTSKDAYYINSAGGTNKLWAIPYTYEKNSSNEASLVLSRDSGDVQHLITFTSAVNASSQWSDSSANGSATLTIKQETHAPDSLVGWTYKTSLMNDTLKFIDDSNAVFYDESDSNFSNRELSNITYTWTKTGPGMGKLTTSLDEETLLFFESNTSGFFDWEETGSEDEISGQFNLYYYPAGKAFESLVGSSITIGDTTYVFTSSNAVTVLSPSGTSSQEYAYLRENEDEVLLSAGSYLYKLDFYNHQYGRIIEGGSGYFSIHQNWATKGWVYYDDLPWIYSNNQGEWMYQVLSENNVTNATELMYYEPWANVWSQNLDLNYTDQRVFSADSEFYWEDYDNFSGPELNSSKWDVGYWGGGQDITINDGKAHLSGGDFSSNAPIQMPSDLVAAAQDSTEGNTFLFFNEEDIYGIQADISIPSQNNEYNTGVYLASLDTNPLGSLGAELRYKTSGPVLLFDYLDSGNEWEHQEAGSLDTFYQLQITKLDGKTSHYLNGNLIKQFDSSSHDDDYWTIGAFNDNGSPYSTFADNVRVLRKKSYPQGWMWTDYYPWAYSYETGGWLYFELAKDTDGDPVMNYYDHKTGSWDLYGPSLSPLSAR